MERKRFVAFNLRSDDVGLKKPPNIIDDSTWGDLTKRVESSRAVEKAFCFIFFFVSNNFSIYIFNTCACVVVLNTSKQQEGQKSSHLIIKIVPNANER